MAGPGVPAIAVPQDHHSGYFVNEEDADMHVDAAMEAAATAAALATPPAQEDGGGERVFRHKKRGTSYAVQGYASLRAEGACETGAVLVIYKGDDGKTWARPHDEFHDGRFVEVTEQEGAGNVSE